MSDKTSLAANIPKDFNRNLAELPDQFIRTLGLLWLFAPRFDWCLGVAVSHWSPHDEAEFWPAEKSSQLLDRLAVVVRSKEALNEVRDEALALLEEAGHLNSARNDFAHSYILAFGPKRELFVQKVRVLNKRKTLALQEGVNWTMDDVEDVTLRLAKWCQKFESMLAKTILSA